MFTLVGHCKGNPEKIKRVYLEIFKELFCEVRGN